MATFTHEPISLVGPVSRLLRLHKGRHDEIKCDLFEAWIGESSGGMSYSALSYTWGASTKNAAITVNERVMNVTTNLLTALQHLRLEDQDQILWIDAICIDQDNNQERTHQVQHMGRIYQEAEKVLIWLGTGNPNSDVAMDAMKQGQLDFFKRVSDCGDSSRGSLRTRGIGNGQKLYYDHRESETMIREGLRDMLGRPWFRRVWILQEVANARVAIVHCGTKSVSARIFAQFPATLGLAPSPHYQVVLDIMPGLSRKESWWGQDRTLYTLLTKFSQSEASDERDNIYALLGISSDASKSIILLPDYEKSLQDVVCDVARFLSQAIGFTLDVSWFFEYFNWNRRRPFEVFTSNRFYSILLKIACEHENEAMVKVLLGSVGTRLDGSFKNKKPLLATAVSKRSGVPVDLLLEESCRIGVKDSLDLSLTEAVRQNQEEIVKILLHYWKWFNFPYDRPPSDLMKSCIADAAYDGHEGIVKILLQAHEVGTALRSSKHALAPWNPASENGQDANDLPQEDQKKWSENIASGCWLAIAFAAEHGYERIVTLLITHVRRLPTKPVDVGSFDTALSAAIAQDQEKIIHLLLEQDNIVAPDNRWRANSLCVAAARGRLEVIKRLLQLGADINSDSTGTPIHHATLNGQFQSVKLLLKRGALSKPERNCQNRRPLSCALEIRDIRIIKLLIGWGENVDTNYQHFETQKWLAEIGVKFEMNNRGMLISTRERKRLLEELSQEKLSQEELSQEELSQEELSQEELSEDELPREYWGRCVLSI